MVRPSLMCGLILVLAPFASAAIIYEPVQYQYRDPVAEAPPFYYGGTRVNVFDAGALQQQRYNMGPTIRGRSSNTTYITTSYASEGRFAFAQNRTGIAGISPVVTYTDLLPAGVNAYPYGFSASDARNEAYANVPLYFRKADLLASGYQTPDGGVIVPAAAPLPGTIEIKPAHGNGPTTQPATAPTTSPILIIPKGLLNKPLKSNPTPVAMAR